jgi:hypothetical protein
VAGSELTRPARSGGERAGGAVGHKERGPAGRGDHAVLDVPREPRPPSLRVPCAVVELVVRVLADPEVSEILVDGFAHLRANKQLGDAFDALFDRW